MTDDYNENDNTEPNLPKWMLKLDELKREAEDQVTVYVPQLPQRKRKSRKKVNALRQTDKKTAASGRRTQQITRLQLQTGLSLA